MRTLHLINSLGAGGAERSLAELLPDLTAHHIEPTVAIFDRTSEGVEHVVLEAGIEIVHIGEPGWTTRSKLVSQLLADRRFELVHTTLFEADVIGRLAAARRRTPVLTSLVNTSYDPVRLADSNVRRSRLRAVQVVEATTARLGSTHFHAISEAVRRSAVDHLRLPPERITVVPRGRKRSRLGEPGPARKRAIRAAMRLPEDATVLVHVGREEFQKGHAVLLDAVGPLLDARPSVHLVLAGRRGNASAEIDRLEGHLPVDQIHRLGHRDDVPDLLACADVFVFPSLYEGLGGAVLEAMAMELPVVTSDLPALREALAEDAVFVASGSTPELRLALDHLLDDRNAQRRLGAAGRRRFEACFDHRRICSDMATLFQTCASGHRV